MPELYFYYILTLLKYHVENVLIYAIERSIATIQ